MKMDLSEAGSKIIFFTSENEKLKKTLDERLKEISRLREEITLAIKEKNDAIGHIVIIKAENDRLVHLLFEKVSDYKAKIMDWHGAMNQLKSDLAAQVEAIKQSYANDRFYV